MKLFLISQDMLTGYEAYTSAVVCAPDAETARQMDPGMLRGLPQGFTKEYEMWVEPEHVKVQEIGEAAPGLPLGVVCASVKAGD